jgi:hypothetical protein
MNTSKENFLRSAVLVLQDRYDINLSYEKVAEIIGDKMEDEWTNFEYEDVSPFMDTAPREEIGEIVSMHYLGRSWPTYGEKVDMKDFHKNLTQKIAQENA